MNPIERVKKLFYVPLSNDVNTNLIAAEHILVLCQEPSCESESKQPIYTLMQCDKNLVAGSPVCQKLAKTITRADVMDIPGVSTYVAGLELLADTQEVVVLSEPKCYLEVGYLDTIEDFYEYLKFADKYMLNIPYICSSIDRIMWLLAIKELQRDIWQKNQILLTNIEQSLFNKAKFSAPTQPVAGNGPYPVRPPSDDPKYVTMKDRAEPKFMSDKDFAILIRILIRGQATDFVSKLITVLGSSIEYCHVIFRNADIINMVQNYPVFPACVFYAFRIMFLEELAMYYRKRDAGRFILDIEAAAALPNCVASSYVDSPYFSLVVRSMPRGGLSLPAQLRGKREIYTMNKFLQRLEVFTNGVFKYIEWKDERSSSALSGSIIPACAIKTPLEKLFKTTQEYFDEYYPRKFITPIETKSPSRCCVSDDVYYDEYCDEYGTDGLTDHKVHTDCTDHTDHKVRTDCTDHTDHKVRTDHTDRTDESPNKITKNTYTDIDLMVACDWAWFDEVAEKHFAAIKRAAAETTPAAKLTMELVETENKHKFIIKGLSRDIDIFHVDDIPGVIVKYHLGCVRAWYDGTTVKCFPSFITAAKIGMNMDIRWTSNRKDVRDTVLKYMQRGFGTVINRADMQSIVDHVNSDSEWPHLRVPDARGRRWEVLRRTREFWTKPFFMDSIGMMFNPSRYRTGIHANISSRATFLALPETKASSLDGRWRRSIAPLSPVDFRTKRRMGRDPRACPAISGYL